MTTTSPSTSFAVTERDASSRTPPEEIARILQNPGFGAVFTDHMVQVEWDRGQGWHDARIVPYGPLQLDPSAAVFHYGQEIFEGMKAYRHEDGSVWTFRPERNAERLNASARRLALPELPPTTFLDAIKELVTLDQGWVPEAGSGETSLYLRPFMIATEAALGVRPSNKALFSVIASPAGSYFAGGLTPVSLWVSDLYVRAAPGGTGAAKCGGNYAASLASQAEGIEHGCDQVVFLDATEHRYVEELGGMNLFFVYADGRVVTPELTGTILAGVTRSSLVELARERGLDVQERKFTIDEWREGVASGEITEVFACGTAAVISPVGRLAWNGGELTMPDSHEVTMSLRQELLDIQYGRAEDSHGWLYRLV
ncbi:branched-chain amino acid aminotransferase [Ornithinimicrobium cerasi]|uniref:Branched-chain-amino-acid aminotransferase n=1 Tax=Ornithinimicrobium cerasi TaxID=2248773 RepID=A0A285VFE3_9MICO|nr:branched-chain amino acid aminotransferase [Ornithinimicrobium cerasi]SOC52673.1 branched chain amino acid aminotransferase apoenzyme [Ornithinimicrobium cerasi]